jgi:hypothetical protein
MTGDARAIFALAGHEASSDIQASYDKVTSLRSHAASSQLTLCSWLTLWDQIETRTHKEQLPSRSCSPRYTSFKHRAIGRLKEICVEACSGFRPSAGGNL